MSGLCISLALMLSVLSLNVAGLRSKNKIEDFFLNMDYDIMVLQETKWDTEMELRIKRIWVGSIYVSNGVDRCCGVAILIKNNDLFKNIKEIHKDKFGRLLILDLDYKNRSIT